MEAKGNHLADATAKQAALSNQIIYTRECCLLPAELIKDSLLQFQKMATEEKKTWQQKGGNSDPDKQIQFGPKGKPILPIGKIAYILTCT